MVQAVGANARVTYVQEVTWGTTPASPSMKLLKAVTPGVQLKASIDKIISNSITSARAIENARGGNRTVSGQVPFELPALGLGTLLKNALGSNSTTGTGPYTHTIKRGTLPAGMSVEIGYTDIAQYQVFAGCKIEDMTLNVGPSGIVTGDFNFIGKTMTASGTSLGTPSSVAHTPYVQQEAVFLEGGASAKVVNFSLKLTNALDAVRVIGNRDIASLQEGKGDLNGTITVLFEDNTMINKVLNETQSTLKVTFTNGANSMEFYLPVVKYFGEAGAGIQTAQGLVIPITFQGLYDSVTELTDLRVTIVNTESSI